MKILLVEDDKQTADYIAKGLREHGHVVDHADNGRDGVAVARAERPHLIVMDVVMPGANGFQATRELSRDPDTAGIPVVMCSTKSDGVDRVWALRQGARDYLPKPVDPDHLLACVAGLVA